jgi:peptidoglycan/xylan/chitin deacetylase (PgdA/CDA1 family)
MFVSRGNFLKTLGKSIPGMVLDGGVATAAHTLWGKMASASSAMKIPAVTAKPEIARIDFIRSGPPDGNRVALTFDDGPTPGVTELILDELKRHKFHATFFMIGQRIAAAPDLARRVLAEGHDVGNHTFTHLNLTALAEQQADAEIQKTQDIIGEVLHHRAVWFRPPYGLLRRNQAGLIHKAGLRPVLWNVDSADWSQPGEASIIRTVLAETTPGSIVVCHDLHAQTANSLGAILDGLVERGLLLATLSALLG